MIGTKVIDTEYGLWGIIWRVRNVDDPRFWIRWCDGSTESIRQSNLSTWGYVLQ